MDWWGKVHKTFRQNDLDSFFQKLHYRAVKPFGEKTFIMIVSTSMIAEERLNLGFLITLSHLGVRIIVSGKPTFLEDISRHATSVLKWQRNNMDIVRTHGRPRSPISQEEDLGFASGSSEACVQKILAEWFPSIPEHLFEREKEFLNRVVPAFFEWTRETEWLRTREKMGEFFRILSPEGVLRISMEMVSSDKDRDGHFASVLSWMRSRDTSENRRKGMPIQFLRNYDRMADDVISLLTPRTKAPLL